MDLDRQLKNKDHYRKRSRSREKRESNERDLKKRRSRSPRQNRHRDEPDKSKPVKLPFQSQHLHKNDFGSYKYLFGEYLDLQKSLHLDDLDENETKGRWKSFLHKWNRGELAEGWYDPVTKEKADERYMSDVKAHGSKGTHRRGIVAKRQGGDHDDDDDDNEYGPVVPGAEATTRKVGPAIPNFQDLQQRREQRDEDRDARISDLRYERKQDRNIQKERLEEMAPRADPGSRERQLEKKRETAFSNRNFAEAKEAGTEEVAESDLLGDDGGDAYKAQKRAVERQKNEREIRKEEVLRARAAEREEKLTELRRKEAKTMEMLKGLRSSGLEVGGESSKPHIRHRSHSDCASDSE